MPLILRLVKGSPLTMQEMDDNLTYLNSLGTTQASITATVSAGAINIGDVVPSGLNLQGFAETLLLKTYYPTFVNPSFSLSNNAGAYNEVGQLVNVLLTFSFDRGQILGSLVSGIWNSSSVQNNRAGAASTYTLDGNVQLGNTLTVTNHVTTQGMNTFSGIVSYLQGPQPINSLSTGYSSPYPAGSSPSQSTSYEGVYPIFATTSSIGVLTKQGLYSMISSNDIELILVAEVGGKQQFEMPLPWLTSRPITGIYYFNTVSNAYDPTNKINDFTHTVTTETIQGNSVTYWLYTNQSPRRGIMKIKIHF